MIWYGRFSFCRFWRNRTLDWLEVSCWNCWKIDCNVDIWDSPFERSPIVTHIPHKVNTPITLWHYSTFNTLKCDILSRKSLFYIKSTLIDAAYIQAFIQLSYTSHRYTRLYKQHIYTGVYEIKLFYNLLIYNNKTDKLNVDWSVFVCEGVGVS